MSFSSRPATFSDYEFVRKAHHLAYLDVVLRQFGNWDDALQDRLFEQTWHQGAFEILHFEGLSFGYAGVDDKPDCIWIRELVLLPEYQSRGIGTQFLRNLFNAAAGKGVPIRLRVLKANRARQLYARLGFRDTSTTETHLLMEWHPENCE